MGYDKYSKITTNMNYRTIPNSHFWSDLNEIINAFDFNSPNKEYLIIGLKNTIEHGYELKSINNVSLVWIEECSEVKYAGFKELIGRLRHPFLKLHMILTTNPVSKSNWCYKHFFIDKKKKRIAENIQNNCSRCLLFKSSFCRCFDKGRFRCCLPFPG